MLGFCGAPWTLASYLVEGGGSRSFAVIKEMMSRDAETLRRLLDLLADVAADVLSFQIASGARAVQLFDTWAGELTLEDYREWALPAVARAIAGIRRTDEPVHPVRQRLRAPAGGHGLVGRRRAFDRLADLARGRAPPAARNAAPGKSRPAALLLGTPEDVDRRTRAMIARTGGAAHIANLGHGILPGARLECVEAFFAAARASLVPAAESSMPVER